MSRASRFASRTLIAAAAIWTAPAGLSLDQAQAGQLQFPANELIPASAGATRNERPRLTFTDDGRSHVFWAKGENTLEFAVLASATSDGTYGPAVPISDGSHGVLTGEGYGPTICAAGSYLAVGWEDRNTANSAAWVARSSNMGNDWEVPLRADPQTTELRDYTGVGLFPDGRLSQTWMKYDANYTNPRYEWTRETTGGGFEAPIVATAVAGLVCECCSPFQMVLADGQTVLFAFRRNSFNIRETHVVRSTDGGTSFSELHRVDTSSWFLQGCPGSGPHMAADGDNVLVSFMSAGSGISHIYTARSTDGGATWDPMVQADDEESATYVNYSQVALRGDIAVIVWEGLAAARSAIYAALSTDQGQSWGVPVVVSDVSGPFLREPTVAISPSYDVEVVWRDMREGVARLYRSRTASDPASIPTDPEDTDPTDGGLAGSLRLAPAFPNPARDIASIPFDLKERATIRMTVHDALGREVALLAAGSYAAGEHAIPWSLQESSGQPVSPGVYWVRLRGNGVSDTTPLRVVR